MTEYEFINQLDQALKSLPAAQRDDILGEYRSHFFEAKERGKSEESVAQGFGDPRAIARTYAADYHFAQWQEPSEGQGIGKSVSHLARGVIVMFSLLFFNFFFILWPVMAAAILLLVAWVVVGLTTMVSIIFAVIALIGGVSTLILSNASAQFALFFYSMATGLLAGLMGLALYSLSRLAVRGILRYIKININLVAP